MIEASHGKGENHLESIFEVQQLYDLLVQFHTLTGIRVTIFDLNMEVITEYPDDRSEYCAIVRSKPELDRNCRMVDRRDCEQCRRSGKLQLYTCFAGLQEVALPIRMNEITLGYIIFGQLRDSEQSRPERVLAFAREHGLPEAELLAAYGKTVCKSRAQIEAAARIMEGCACYMWITEQVKFADENLMYNLSNYINLHLSEDLSVERLCDIFQISRSTLYKITNTYMDIGIAEYIRKTRISAAKKMLAQNESVSAVARKSGFEDYNYFSKVFKRETGLSPSQYKKKLRIGVAWHAPESLASD